MTTPVPDRHVVGYDGLTGRLLGDVPDDPAQSVEVELDGGRRIVVASGSLARGDRGWILPLSAADVLRSLGASSEAQVIPVVHEQIHIEKRVVDTARVRIRKRISEHVEEVAPELLREEVDIQRVAVNRYVDAPVAPHHDGDTLVIPLVEEVLVLEKRLLLREEIRVTKGRVAVPSTPQQVVLRREDVEIERIPLEAAEPPPPRRS